MSHAKQLHHRRYFDDYMEIINRKGLPGNVTSELCEQVNRAVVNLVAREGVDVWYTDKVDALVPAGTKCGKCGATKFTKEMDILDVWFDSGCSHPAVLKKRPERTWPAAVYLEGHDQHCGWFQSSLLVGTALEGRAPYNAVVTCGFIVNEAGEKMSKSRGNAVSPQEVIKQSGADIIRLWVGMIDYHEDMAWGREISTRASEAD